MERRWAEIKKEALDELQTGHRASKAMEGYEPNCWQRAQYLAIRQELSDGWQPQNGIERQLIDAMAQAQTASFHWLATLAVWTTAEVAAGNRLHRESGRWRPIRVTESEAIEQAASMVERYNRIFLRTLRALQDLRRRPPVIVQNASQVNVANQQLNMGGG